MAKKSVQEIPWYRRISIGRLISLAFSLIMVFILFTVLGVFISLIAAPLPSGNIAIITVEGTISGGSYRYMSVASSPAIVDLIEKAEKNDEIKAIVVEINSGGGSPVGSDEIAMAVKRAEKPTVAVIREVGASGAYWIASAADKIYANRMSITGSIGVIGDYLEFARLLEDYNITYRMFKSGKYKAMGSPFKEMTGEEADIFQKNVDKIHNFFVEAVAENRNMPEEDVRQIATGEIFLGVEAKEIGLVDELGTLQDALKELEEQLNITADAARYTPRASLYDYLSAGSRNPISGLVDAARTPGKISVQT